MSLTKDQIQELYKFTRAHYVEHYDLQTELVDHLANGIEKQWIMHPNQSFEEAKQKEFKKFGVYGFQKVVTARSKMMGKKYRIIIYRFLSEWFQLPKLLSTTLSCLILFFLIHQIGDLQTKQIVCFSLLFLIVLGIYFYQYRTRTDRELQMVKGGKKWFLGEMIYGIGDTPVIASFIFQIVNSVIIIKPEIVSSVLFELIYSLAVVGMLLLAYVTLVIIPAKAEQLLAETYPEYKTD